MMANANDVEGWWTVKNSGEALHRFIAGNKLPSPTRYIEFQDDGYEKCVNNNA